LSHIHHIQFFNQILARGLMQMKWTEANLYFLSTEIFTDKYTTAFLCGKKKIVICGIWEENGSWEGNGSFLFKEVIPSQSVAELQ